MSLMTNNQHAEQILSRRIVLGILFILSLMVGLNGMANATPGIVVEDVDADFATGLYKETAVDMRVKVMGGFVRAKRTWYNNRWIFNYAWSDLHFEFKKSVTLPEGVPSTIRRNFMIYELVDAKASTLVWRFNDKRKTITKTATGYRWADREGNWKEYDEDGKLLKYGDRNNVTVSFTRHLNGKIEHIKDHFDNIVITYEYNAADEVSRIVDYTGREVLYTYNPQGLLSEVTDVLGYVWKYGYGNYTSNNLTGPGDLFSIGNMLSTKTDPEGNVTHINYAITGGTPVCIPSGGGYWRINPDTGLEEYVGNCTWLDSPRTLILTSIEYPDGRRQGYGFSYTGSKKLYNRRSRDASNRLVEEWIDLEGIVTRRLVNGKEEFAFKKDGNSEIITNALGHQTRTDFDQWRNPLKVTYPDGAFETWKYESTYSNVIEEVNENGVKTTYEYDANGNRIKMTEAVGLPEQRITEYTYDAYGNMLREKRLGDAVTEEALTTYTYDDYGNIKTKTVSVSASESHTINYLVYDVLGNLLEWRDGRNKLWKQTFDATGNRKSITNPLTYTYSFDYDGVGNQIKITNPDNKSTQYIFSAGNRLDKIIDPANAEKRYVYNTKGQIVTTYDEENHPTHSSYDSQGRLSQIIDGVGNIITLVYGVSTSRNVTLDRLAAINYPTYRQEMKYDNRGRQTQRIDILDANTQHITERNYDATGNITLVVDAEQKSTGFNYDALGRLMLITNPDATTVTYVYDNRDNLLSVTNEKHVVIRRFVYDRKNRITQEILANGEIRQFNYDENDNLIQKIDAKGQISRYRYDDANRLDQITYFGNENETIPAKTVSFSYNSINSLTGYDDGETSAMYIYDDLQRKTGETINYGAFTKSISYTYKKNGLKETFTDADNITVTYTYDAANRLAQISLPGEGNITYNTYKWAAPEKVTYPGGNTRELQYDPLMRIQRITAKDPAQNILMDYQYGYDKVGNPKTKNTEHGDYLYGYDDRYRLTSANNPTLPDETFSYDDAGNRLTDAFTTGVWQYNNSNQLQSYSDVVLGYDDNGSRISKIVNGQATTYLYNHENRLTEVHDNTNNVTATYYYDPFGKRIWKDVDRIRIYFIYAEEGLLTEMDASGNSMRSYGYVPDSLYGTDSLYLRTNAGYSYYHADNLGTPQILVNKTGQIQWQGRQETFGEVTETISLISNPLRFPGQYEDKETGLHYNYFRNYDADIGGYLESDPLGLKGGINLYHYAMANTTKYMDPSGLSMTAAIVSDGKIFGGKKIGHWLKEVICGISEATKSKHEIETERVHKIFNEQLKIHRETCEERSNYYCKAEETDPGYSKCNECKTNCRIKEDALNDSYVEAIERVNDNYDVNPDLIALCKLFGLDISEMIIN